MTIVINILHTLLIILMKPYNLMNTGDIMQYSTYTLTIYDYLIANNILEQFLYNRTKYKNIRDTHKSERSVIDNAFIWDRTVEGHTFWSKHNRDLSNLLKNIDPCSITLAELITNLNDLMQQPQIYEFW